MNPIQQRLLDLSQVHNLDEMRKVDLVELVGCEYPSQITHHLGQLKKRGDLILKNGRLTPALKTHTGLVRIPVLGEADCGEATKYADAKAEESLLVSPSVLRTKGADNIYALIARGDSMNRTDIHGKSIEDGDYVIVEKRDNYVPADHDVVVSVIGGLANIKRFKYDKHNGRILLVSESHRKGDFMPIIIADDDDYSVSGKVIDVVKGVREN